MSSLFFDPGTQFPGTKKCALHRKKPPWNGHHSYSLTKLLCSRTAMNGTETLKENRESLKQKLVSLLSPDCTESLQPSLDRKAQPDVLVGPSYSTAVGWNT